MKKIITVIIILGLLCWAAPDYGATERNIPLTLADCYRLALIQSEIIAINVDLIKETEAHFLQALSTVLPHVSFESSDFQEAEPALEGVTSSLSTSRKSSTRNFNATQTLFNGFKAIAAIRGSKYERNQRTDEKTRAEQLLLADVADAFYILMEERQDIKALERIRAALSDRVKELISREKLGRSRPSEVVNAKAQFYNVKSQIEQVKAQEVIARQLLEFLIGQPVGEIVDTYKFPITLKAEDYYVSKASTRPDVTASKFAWEVAKENARAADSDFLPQVDVETNYYTQRSGLDKGTDWDVLLSVNVPIFEGTETLGNSKAAMLKADESMQLYNRAKRLAPYDIKDAYVTLNAAMVVHDSLRKAYATARLNYYLQKKDYRRSLVNNLDVLASIQTLQNTERDYIHALYVAKRSYWHLMVAIGQSLNGESE